MHTTGLGRNISSLFENNLSQLYKIVHENPYLHCNCPYCGGHDWRSGMLEERRICQYLCYFVVATNLKFFRIQILHPLMATFIYWVQY